jgi:hypothetical protein
MTTNRNLLGIIAAGLAGVLVTGLINLTRK